MGILPASTASLLFVPLFAALGALAVAFGGELGVWVWIAWIPASIVGCLTLAAALRAVEYSIVCWRSCPRCDRKTWTSGARELGV
jgi:hypothetical protein